MQTIEREIKNRLEDTGHARDSKYLLIYREWDETMYQAIEREYRELGLVVPDTLEDFISCGSDLVIEIV